MTDLSAAFLTAFCLTLCANVWVAIGRRLGWVQAWQRIPMSDRIFAGAVALWVVAFAAWMGAG
jgi:hypothetical protein